MKYSACLGMLYQESDFIERIYKTKKSGFDAAEFWLWQSKDIAAIRKALDETGLEAGIFQGNIEGRMIDPKDNTVYIEGVKKSIKAAKELGARHLFLMTDILKADRTVLEPSYCISEEEKIESVMAGQGSLYSKQRPWCTWVLYYPCGVRLLPRGTSKNL